MVKNWIERPTYKQMFTIFSCKAPFDDLDTEINIIGDSEEDVLGLSNELFYAIRNNESEVMMFPLNGYMEESGRIIYELPIEGISQGTIAHEKFHRKVKLMGISSNNGLASVWNPSGSIVM